MIAKSLLVTLFLIVTSQALTINEIAVLITNSHGTTPNTSDFRVTYINDSHIRFEISGVPKHPTEQCFNTTLGCCLPQRTPRQREITVPRRPVATSTSYCIPTGPVGVSTSGVLFNHHLRFDCANNVAQEDLDACNGRLSRDGSYHYYSTPNPVNCFGNPDPNEAHIIGIAMDGFPIYDSSLFDGSLQVLDECGGFMPGGDGSRYRYVAPYTSSSARPVISCFKGIPINAKCCECQVCGTEEIPNCQNVRPGPSTGGRRPNAQGGRPNFQGGRRPSRGFGNQAGGRPGIFGRRPGTGRFGGRPSGNANVQTKKGFCTLSQLMTLRGELGNRNQQQETNCSGCNDCIPRGGLVDEDKVQRCRRCKIQSRAANAVRPQNNRFSFFGLFG